jgi:biotin carboxylase
VEYSVGPLTKGGKDAEAKDNDKNRRRRVVVLMDCFTPYLGLYVSNRIRADYRDVAVVYVLSDYLRVFSLLTQPDEARQWEAATIPGSDPLQVEEWKGRVFPGVDRNHVEWVGVYSESDSGLDDAERLRLLLNVTCQDDPVVLTDRRHKYYMNERVGDQGGLPTVRQKLCSSVDEVLEFAREELLDAQEEKDGSATGSVRRVIIKPFRGCGTESVHLCESLEQALEAWNTITNTTVFGTHELHSTVLAQEFLQGIEYAVDVVVRDGSYKVAAVWRYDKRPANGAPFCYFRTQLVDAASDPNVNSITEYVYQSLRALGVRWGISHNEVIVTSDRGPVLVEVNCRQHNMDFCPITMCCIGYNALDMMVEAMLGTASDWDRYPDLPSLQASGCMVHLVNYASGRVVGAHSLDEIAGLSSVFNMEVYDSFLSPGSTIEPTVDIKTDAGWVQLVNDDDEVLERDYAEIVRLMPTMFQVEP